MAVNEEQNKRLDALFERGLKNNVRDLKLIDGNEIKKIEPNCVVNITCKKEKLFAICICGKSSIHE